MEPKDHRNDIELASLDKKGTSILSALDKGCMVAIQSETEIMYVFSAEGMYLCYIHALDEPEGRCHSFPQNHETRTMVKSMAQLADHLFEVSYRPEMERLGVMFAAEQGIVDWLDVTDNLPIEDVDFMAPYEANEKNESGEEQGNSSNLHNNTNSSIE